MEVQEIDTVLDNYKYFCESILGKTYAHLKTPFCCLTPHKVYLFTHSEIEQVKLFLSQFEKYFLHCDTSNSAGSKQEVYIIDPEILTIADLYIICDLSNLRVLGIELESYPIVYRYLQRYFNNVLFMTAHTDFLLYCETKIKNLDKNFGLMETDKKVKIL